MKASFSCSILLLLLVVSVSSIGKGKESRAIVVYDDHATEITVASLPDTAVADLWVSTGDLKLATGFEVKPQGVCRAELCFPLPKSRMHDFLRGKNGGDKPGEQQFNLTAFAILVHQAVAHDDAVGMWYFGLRGDQQEQLASLRAPDFTLPDLSGKKHSLSDFRGKKLLLVTWASW